MSHMPAKKHINLTGALRQHFQLLSCHHVTLAAGLEVGDAAFQRADHRVG